MTDKNPLQHLADFGQSVWCDNLSREMLTSGSLQQLIDDDGIVGITSNPTIFDNAISKSNDYEDQMRELLREGRSASEIQDALMIKDIQDACDILFPVFEASGGQDGVVSLEVSPLLANDTERTISEARRLNRLVGRPNVMIKIPGTPAGVPAIEQALYEGINVNITLLFSLQAYRDVMEAYLRGMERRVADDKPVHDIVSVASFFVSRVDSEVDSRLEAIIQEDKDHERAATARALLGQIAIANARLAYHEFKTVFNSTRFNELAGYGVRIQRPLWASTSTKNPAYSDTLYVDELIGPNTVETLAPASIDAFRDHGTVALTVEKDIDIATDAIQAMESLGIAYDDVIDVLISEGVEKFAESFESLSASIAAEVERIAEELRDERRQQLGAIADSYDDGLASLSESGVVDALRNASGGFWSDNAQTAREIGGLLGWLFTAPEMQQRAAAGQFASLAMDVEKRGYDRLVLLGMGGSSLAPEVMARTLSSQPGYPALSVLDSTHPETIRRVADGLGDERTLFVVSSKSGTTIETETLFDYFLDLKGGNADDFIIITDPGSHLEARARNLGAWKVYTNRHDIGGRFSALSYFGLVPAAAAGIDVDGLLADATSVLPINNIDHPGVVLGAALGAAAGAGRNKLTLLCSADWAAFGDWLEQLIAESTGKHETGIVPIVGEHYRDVADYGDDRVFALIQDGDSEAASLAKALQQAGHPVVSLPANLGQLFMIWEVATAVVGKSLGINPFDQPNVQEAKDQTNRVLASSDSETIPTSNSSNAVEQILKLAGRGTYVAIQAFVDASEDMNVALTQLRESFAVSTPVPVTLGIGPRFLHSSGQLHKGGPRQGLFLQIVQEPGDDLAIPGKEWGFGHLFGAQADGDYLALASRDLHVIRTNIETVDDVEQMARAAKATSVVAD